MAAPPRLRGIDPRRDRHAVARCHDQRIGPPEGAIQKARVIGDVVHRGEQAGVNARLIHRRAQTREPCIVFGGGEGQDALALVKAVKSRTVHRHSSFSEAAARRGTIFPRRALRQSKIPACRMGDRAGASCAGDAIAFSPERQIERKSPRCQVPSFRRVRFAFSQIGGTRRTHETLIDPREPCRDVRGLGAQFRQPTRSGAPTERETNAR